MLEGLIVSNISDLFQVEIDNEIFECRVRGKFKKNEIFPVVGDFVKIEKIANEKNKGIIEEISPRKMYSKRPKIANLTQIILVISLKSPKPDFLLLDKQLAYAEYLKIKPIICINKIDLGKREVVDEIHQIYERIGYKVVDTIANKEKVQCLEKLLNNEITAFSGNSGVGKSTLINSIFGEEKTQEGIISDRIKRGKNTTTNTTLYKIKNGYIADTPGFSTFDITEIESNKLALYYKEFKQYINDCEYLDCNHIKEENCGIKKALSEGKISKQRYERYCKIFEELKDKEEHKW